MAQRCPLFVLLLTVAGCSPGFVFTRAFTQDSRYLLWQDCAGCGFSVKRTNCETGQTVTLGRGNFAVDKTGRYVLCYPEAFREKVPSLVRLEDRASRQIPLWPGGHGLIGDCVIELEVDSFDPVRLTFTDVNEVDKKFTVFGYDEGTWWLAESGKARDEHLHAANEIAGRRLFSTEELKAVQQTRSPDGRYVLIEHLQGVIAVYSELLCSDKKRAIRLTTQTDQGLVWLGRFGELLIFGKNADWN